MPIVDATRALAVRRGVRIEVITVGWMVAEAVVAVWAGVAAHSVLLTAFGFDAVVELLSGIVVLQLLATEAGGADRGRVERLEPTTTRISAVLLVLLCAYVVLTTVGGLVMRLRPEASVVGVGVAAVALVAMPLLANAKRGVNRVINSASLRADIAETISCAYLAAITLAGLAVTAVFGWWWADYVAAFALLIFLVPETREAIEVAFTRTGADRPQR
jgi:divalent metal cation (Fe/Co/Zn/Cd) transporter